jgi:nitrate reductase NapD
MVRGGFSVNEDRRQFFRGAWAQRFTRLATPDGAMEIASLVIHVRPELLDAVGRAIALLPGTEVAASDPRGKLVVIVEAGPGDRLGERLTELSVMPNVISATLVYHAAAAASIAGAARHDA